MQDSQVIALIETLVHCLSFQSTVIKIENDPSLYKHNLKAKIKSLTDECEKMLDCYTERKKNDDPDLAHMKNVMQDNLKEFYQLFEFIMNLNASDINEVKNYVFDNMYSKEEYQELKEKLTYKKLEHA